MATSVGYNGSGHPLYVLSESSGAQWVSTGGFKSQVRTQIESFPSSSSLLLLVGFASFNLFMLRFVFIWLFKYFSCFVLFCCFVLYRVFSSHLGFVHPLQDVALHQCLPSSSVCCLPNPGGSLLLCYVILPSSAWSSSRPLPSPWLSLCASPCPPIVL